jgi:hypothetical protein
VLLEGLFLVHPCRLWMVVVGRLLLCHLYLLVEGQMVGLQLVGVQIFLVLL